MSKRSETENEITSPDLPNEAKVHDLSRTVADAVRQSEDVEGERFENATTDGLSGTSLEFSSCIFEHCAFSDWDFHRVSFVDCLFDHCDFNGFRLENVTFQRVRFSACRLTGAEFLDASLTNVLFSDCSADYFALSGSGCAHTRFSACRFRESIWEDVKLKGPSFADCDLTSARFHAVPMDGQDMTTCTLDSLQIDPYDLRGMKVTPLQGLMFCSLLGLKISE